LEANKEAELVKAQAKLETDIEKLVATKAIEQMKATIQRDAELKKARIQQETDIQKTAMTVAGQVMAAKQSAEASESEVEEPEDNGVQESIAAMAETLKMLTAPKKVIRDASGRISGVVTE